MVLTITLSVGCRPLPASLTHRVGVTFLPPDLRVTTAELERKDRQYRARREAAYARAWAEDATLVGSIRTLTRDDDRRSVYSGRMTRRRRKALMKLVQWIEVGRGHSNSRSSADQQQSETPARQSVEQALEGSSPSATLALMHNNNNNNSSSTSVSAANEPVPRGRASLSWTRPWPTASNGNSRRTSLQVNDASRSSSNNNSRVFLSRHAE